MVNQVLVYGDGVHDDTEALTKIIAGKARGVFPDGTPYPGKGKRFLITKALDLKDSAWVDSGGNTVFHYARKP